MRAGLIVVVGVTAHDAAQMCLAQHHQMVGALASYRADQSLHMRILLGRARTGGAVSDPQATQTTLHNITIGGITVSHEIFRCLIPRKCLDKLLSDPLRSGMRRHRMMNQPSPPVSQDDQAIEQFEADRGHDEEIGCRNPVRVVAQERIPPLPRSSGTLDTVD